MERILVAVAAKYLCGRSVVQRVLVAAAAKVANFMYDYLVINRCWLVWLQGTYVSIW